MSVKKSIIEYILNYFITLIREFRDSYMGYDHDENKVPTNTSTKKKWDKWVKRHVK